MAKERFGRKPFGLPGTQGPAASVRVVAVVDVTSTRLVDVREHVVG
jgi:hypothetical protein